MSKKKKKSATQEKKEKKREHRGMICVFAKCDCGCCTATLHFKTPENAAKAFAGAGLNNSATIEDDEGVKHECIDTFYGFSLDEKDAKGRSLGYLFEQMKDILCS